MTDTQVPELILENISTTTPAIVEQYPERLVKREEKEQTSRNFNAEIYIRHYFSDLPIMADIAYCESSFRQFDSTGRVLRGKVNRYDVGVLQINELYHLKTAQKLGYDIRTLEGNASYARYLYEREGARPWMSSSPCWAKFSQSEIAKK